MLMHCFWVFGFKSWFEFEVCLLFKFGLEIGIEIEKKRENQTASLVLPQPSPARSAAHFT
jgi:hypothetical protein